MEVKNEKGDIKTSGRLRATLRVAELAGFKYDDKRYKYGGFLSTYELEKIGRMLEEFKRTTFITYEASRKSK
jgi:hypothetical protein